MHVIEIGKKKIQVADSWDKVRPSQMLQLMPLVFCYEKSWALKVECLKILLPLEKSIWRKLTPEQVYDMLAVVAWLWEKPLTVTPLTHFKYKGVEYLLPEPRFAYCAAIEFAMADLHFRAFCKPKPDLKALHKLISTLCRPIDAAVDQSNPDWNGDPRQKYNSKHADARALLFEGLPMAVKVMVLQFVAASFSEIQKQYKIIFESAGQGGTSAGAVPPWIACLMEISEKGTFGDWEKLCFTPVHTIFLYLKAKKEAHDQ
jgi:hypothetical protein